jgi:hypothetical protein
MELFPCKTALNRQLQQTSYSPLTYTAKEYFVVCGILDIILKKKTFKLTLIPIDKFITSVILQIVFKLLKL